jgi:hypothetical protein
LWQISKQLEYLSGITYNSGGGSGSGTSGSSGTSGGSGTSGSAGTAGISGSSGSSGLTGTSGLSGDRYKTESVTEFTLGNAGGIIVGTGLSYTTAQDISIVYDSANHQVSMVVSYDSGTGALVFSAPSETTGSGTYSDWTVNLNGAAGGNGTAGTSGSAGTSGESGTSGIAGTSGSSGTSGATGTNGSSGTSASSGSSGITGTNGSSGTAGTSATSGLTGTAGTSASSGSSGTAATAGTTGTSGSSGSSGTSFNPPAPLVYGLYAQTANSDTVTNTTTETTVIGTGTGTLTVGANQFSVGDSYRADFGGVLNVANNQTIRIRIKTGSVILADSGVQAITNITSDIWSLSINFTIRTTGAATVASIVTLGGFHYTKTNNGTVEGFSWNAVNNTTFNTTISNTLDVTVQWGSASTSNQIYSDIFVLNKIY